MKIEVREVIGYRGESQAPENAIVGKFVESAEVEELTEFAVCAVADDSRIEVLGVFTNTQAEVCRDLLHKLPDAPVVFIGPCAHDPRTGHHELVDETADTDFCEWGVFKGRLYGEFELLEVFAFRSDAIEALGAVQRYRSLNTYSFAEMRAAVHMMQWATITVTMMMVNEVDPVLGPKLLALVQNVSHQEFRDIFIRLAPFHAEGQAEGMRANGITDYKGSHDKAWTVCFLTKMVNITRTGIEVRPDWKDEAIRLWRLYKDEIEKGIAPAD